jgi:hypothetical protein
VGVGVTREAVGVERDILLVLFEPSISDQMVAWSRI